MVRSCCAPTRRKLALLVVVPAAALALLAATGALAWLLLAALPHPDPEGGGADGSLAEDAEVIGVSVNGQHRAYPLGALAKGPASHIVNDLLGGRPLSVAYCDVHDCVQVVTGEGSRPLELWAGGLDARSMLLAVGKHRYREDTLEPLEAGAPAFPYRKQGWERTTWGAWKRAHPDTHLFLGPPPR
jgi:hypothetical protein